MALSNAASGGIILVVLITVLMTMPQLLENTLSLQDASTEASDIDNLISKTKIDLSSLTAPTSNSDELSFSIDNTGEEKLWNYDSFTVIVTFDDVSGRLIEELSFAGQCSGQPTQGTWCNNGITTDLLDPDILNEDESMAVLGTVSTDFATGIVIVVVSTDNGVVASSSLSVP